MGATEACLDCGSLSAFALGLLLYRHAGHQNSGTTKTRITKKSGEGKARFEKARDGPGKS
jgi:hypothetical protein